MEKPLETPKYNEKEIIDNLNYTMSLKSIKNSLQLYK